VLRGKKDDLERIFENCYTTLIFGSANKFSEYFGQGIFILFKLFFSENRFLSKYKNKDILCVTKNLNFSSYQNRKSLNILVTKRYNLFLKTVLKDKNFAKFYF
jgi:hypothetical protein